MNILYMCQGNDSGVHWNTCDTIFADPVAAYEHGKVHSNPNEDDTTFILTTREELDA